MKKTAAIAVFVLILALTACGRRSPSAETPQSGGTVQIPNPWRDVTEAEVKALCQGSLNVPEGAENIQWSVMEPAGEPALVQLSFDLNGLPFTAREPTTNDKAADISGMHYTWTAQTDMTLKNWEESARTGIYYRCIGQDEWADLCVWYDTAKGISYSVSVAAKDLDGFDLQAIAEALHAPTAPTAQATLSVEEQRRILEANRSLWAFDEGDFAPDWYYTFTDLDHNGLLEVISASTQGSGIFTYVHFYEVLPDSSGVKNLYHADVEIEGPDDWPEIIRDALPCYYDRAADRWYYVCANDIRDGAAHSMSQLAALCLKDGVAEWEHLASVDIQWTEAGEQKTYMDSAGNPISEQDFNSAVERRFAGMEQSELKLEWTAVTSTAEAEASTENEPGNKKLSDEQALAAIRQYCFVSNPDLESIVNAGDQQVYWDIQSSTDTEIVVLFRSYTGALIRYYIDSVSGETYVTEFVPGITSEEQRTEESFNAKDFLLSIPGTWQTASIVSENDGTAHPEYYVRFTDSEILYGHMRDGAFVLDHSDKIVRLEETAAGGFKVQAEAANGVQYSFQTSKSDDTIMEYYETWNEADFPAMYRGGSSLSRCS